MLTLKGRSYARFFVSLSVSVLVSITSLAACTADTDNEQSQLPDGVVMMSDRPADTITLVPPKGWECYNKKPQPVVAYKCVRRADSDGRLSYLRIEIIAPRRLPKIGSPFDNGKEAVDMAEYFNSYYKENQKTPEVTQLERLPERTIDGAKAYGQTFIGTSTYKKEPTQYRKTEWILGRSDGLWKIVLVSADGSDTIPSELLQAVDTITWIPTPEPEPQSSGGNDKE